MVNSFWVFMLVMSLLVPAVMLVYGWLFWKKPPETISGSYGYRSPRSMRNQETWRFAHEYCGKVWFRMGWVVLAGSVLWMALALRTVDIERMGRSTCILVAVQLVFCLAAIPLTERALKREFDESGKRR